MRRAAHRNGSEIMFENMFLVFSQTLTLFLIIAAGFILTKLGLINEKGTHQMSAVLVNAVAPCMFINSLSIDRTGEMIHILFIGIGAMLVCYAVYISLPYLFFRREPEDTRITLRYGSGYNNAGFMGMPLVVAVFGQDAAFYAMFSIICFNVYAYTVGVRAMGGKGTVSLRRMLFSPGIIGILIGLVLFLTGLRLPAPAASAVSYVGGMNTPLSMLIIGSQMARADIRDMLRSAGLYGAAAIKLLLMPVIAAIILLPLRGFTMFYAVSVVLAGAPSAGYTAIFAEMYHRDSTRAAELVSFSTLMSILTLPVVATAVKMFTGL